MPKEYVSIQNNYNRYYQYTILDECSRKRFLCYCKEHSMYETVKALIGRIKFFGYKPLLIQTDNGFGFIDRTIASDKKEKKNIKINYIESCLVKQQVEHKFIRPRTHEHNGKVERSHRIDQEKFYRYLKFYSFGDLCKQGAIWNIKYNKLPKVCFGN